MRNTKIRRTPEIRVSITVFNIESNCLSVFFSDISVFQILSTILKFFRPALHFRAVAILP